MSKKAQIALFLILGFVVLVAFGFIYYIYGISHKDKIEVEAEKSAKISFSLYNINIFLDNCFKNLASEAVDYVSLRGGYFILPKKFYNYGIISTAFYFYEDTSLLPKIEVLEESISDYIKAYGNDCFEELKNLTEAESIDYKIENVSTKILENSIVIIINAPTKIQLLSTTYELTKFIVEMNNNHLYDIYTFSNFLVDKQLEDKYSICLSCIINKGIESNFFTYIENVGDNTLLFTIMHNDTRINELKKFTFANKYKQISCNNLPIDAEEDFLISLAQDCAQREIEKFNYSFYVEDIDNLIAYVGTPFTARVKASGHNIEFIDHTDLFDIDSKTGIINFVPTEEQIGEHIILIQIIDAFDNKDLKALNITIKNQNEN